LNIGSLLFRITTAAVFFQLLLGGLLTFDFISPGPHIITGVIVFFLAVATMIVSLVIKPKSRALQISSFLLVVLIIVQIILGFIALGSGNQVISWIHFVNALLIFGATISGVFVSLRIGPSNKISALNKENRITS
jgi:heme A synthase